MEKNSPPHETSLRQWSRAGIIVGVALISFGFLISWLNVRRLSEEDDWVAHTQAVQASVETALRHITEIENSARGYAATGDKAFEAPYRAAEDAIAGDLDLLGALTIDNQLQRQHMSDLRVQIRARIAATDATIAERKRTGKVPAPRFFLDGKQRMDAVWTTFRVMQDEETVLLDQRKKSALATRQRAETVIQVSALVGIILLLLAGAVTDREIRRGEKMRREIVALNEDLERRVGERTVELRESQRRLELFVEHAPAALAMFDRSMRYVQVSQRWLMDYGLDQRDVRGVSHYDVFPELPAQWKEAHRRGLEGEVLQGQSDRFERADGTVQWVRWETRPWYEASGGIGGIVVFTEDVTERKRAEDALRLSNARTRFAMEAAKLGDWQLDLSTLEATRSLMHDQIFGYPILLPEWNFDTFLSHVHPDDQERVQETFQRSTGLGKRWEFECRIIRVDGAMRWIWGCGDAQRESSGETTGMFGIVKDITDWKRAEEDARMLNAELENRVIQRTAQLEAANKELEAFTYSVSHDLRAPLRHISGFSKILTEEFGSALPSEARRHLQRIEDGTHRMGQLVDDLLNLARVGRRDLSLQVAGFRSLVDEVIEELGPEIGERNVQWKIGDLPYADCDAALIKQVFQNLLWNAIKFTRPRERAIIEIGQEQRDGYEAVYVRDNGVGFSMKYRDKLFGVFQRLHRAEDFEGTGVGLATVQRIIQKHGGKIWAEAELDHGATFYFTLGPEQNGFKSKAAAATEKA
jgi:PAS domain S-box-containing protein